MMAFLSKVLSAISASNCVSRWTPRKIGILGRIESEFAGSRVRQDLRSLIQCFGNAFQYCQEFCG
jgi:hypothetical protein